MVAGDNTHLREWTSGIGRSDRPVSASICFNFWFHRLETSKHGHPVVPPIFDSISWSIEVNVGVKNGGNRHWSIFSMADTMPFEGKHRALKEVAAGTNQKNISRDTLLEMDVIVRTSKMFQELDAEVFPKRSLIPPFQLSWKKNSAPSVIVGDFRRHLRHYYDEKRLYQMDSHKFFHLGGHKIKQKDYLAVYRVGDTLDRTPRLSPTTMATTSLEIIQILFIFSLSAPDVVTTSWLWAKRFSRNTDNLLKPLDSTIYPLEWLDYKVRSVFLVHFAIPHQGIKVAFVASVSKDSMGKLIWNRYLRKPILGPTIKVAYKDYIVLVEESQQQ